MQIILLALSQEDAKPVTPTRQTHTSARKLSADFSSHRPREGWAT